MQSTTSRNALRLEAQRDAAASGAVDAEAPAVISTMLDAPPICSIMLEFETWYWGEWAPPHAPNTVIPIMDGGTDGVSAKDDATGLVVVATAVGVPFFTLALVAINVATGDATIVGNNWPYAPPGFSGRNGLFSALEQDPHWGFVVFMTEISNLGPVPSREPEPGLPVGWSVAAVLDPSTGNTTALTADLSPVLQPFPVLVYGLSALDGARATLWLFSADEGAAPEVMSHGASLLRRSNVGLTGAAVVDAEASPGAYFLGVSLSMNPQTSAAPPTVIPTRGGGFIVTAFEFSTAVDSIVTIEYNASGNVPPAWDKLTSSVAIAVYPVNGSAPTVIATIPAGTILPAETVGASQISADGRFVYFSATQGSSEFESAALVVVDLLNHTYTLTLAAPDDEYDVVNLYRC